MTPNMFYIGGWDIFDEWGYLLEPRKTSKQKILNCSAEQLTHLYEKIAGSKFSCIRMENLCELSNCSKI